MSRRIGRRRFVQELAMGAAGLALLRGVARAARRGGLKLQGEPKNVVILGGGLAGLAAAYELKKAGHSITILEARKFAGGRLQTIREFADGQYAEAGPLSFPQSHEFTFGYATDFNLPLRPVFTFLDSMANIRGHLFRFPVSGNANVPFSLRASERAAGIAGLMSLYLADYMRQVGNPLQPNWPPDELRQIDAVSLKQLLQDLGASDGAIDIIAASQLGILGFGLDSFSAMDGVVTEAIASGSASYEIAGGNDQLATKLKKKVKKAFNKGCVVQRIEQNEASVTITYLKSGELQTITADRVICTIPFPVLKDIEIPSLPEDKAQAIRDLKLTPVTRTYQQFRKRVWEQAGLSGYGITDLEIQNTYSPTLQQLGSRGILTAYTGGQRAIDLAAMSEGDRQSFVLRKMGNVFSNLNNSYQSGVSHIWQEDQFARGAFTYFEPGQMATLLPLAQRAEGRIHFAGEHTSVWHGWMNGALESGNRAADEVNKAEATQSISVAS
ncbi:MAG TPA: NAD(P)/FAD-dependent oxidoreductase [Blastocatellia bacterium]|nr:NAD(P)/FAD-dependent oxidoreductase [Blastocatellia bacterium]